MVCSYQSHTIRKTAGILEAFIALSSFAHLINQPHVQSSRFSLSTGVPLSKTKGFTIILRSI